MEEAGPGPNRDDLFRLDPELPDPALKMVIAITIVIRRNPAVSSSVSSLMTFDILMTCQMQKPVRIDQTLILLFHSNPD
ncbi:MAG: hypothetical protein GYA23_02450 [Methanomicrobiales archaeon]|nr:hypothetical protein [Methanomicrobiales archaeon]